MLLRLLRRLAQVCRDHGGIDPDILGFAAGDHLAELIDLTRSDCTTRNQRKAATLARRMDELEERIGVLRQQEALDAIRPDLDGQQVMAHLGVGPGRHVGEALAFLLEVRMEEGPLDHDEALGRLDAWWAARGGAGANGGPPSGASPTA